MMLSYDDEAGIYDRLAILEIKLSRGAKVQVQQQRLWRDIVWQLGMERHAMIHDSPEFTKLYQINEMVFDLIDRLRKHGEWKGGQKAIDDCNMDRWRAKRALQDRFFSDKPFAEVKL